MPNETLVYLEDEDLKVFFQYSISEFEKQLSSLEGTDRELFDNNLR